MTRLKRFTSCLLCAVVLIGNFAAVPVSASSKGITLPKVTYHVINADSGDYLSLYRNADEEEQSITLEEFAFDIDSDAFDREARQVFKFEKNKKGNYNLQPAMSSTRNIAPEAVPAESGDRVRLYDPEAGKWQGWNIYEYDEGLYIIRNSKDPKLVLTQKGSKATVSTYKEGKESQLWKLDEFSLKREGDNENIKAYGIDVSQWQGEINWEAVKEYGVEFAIIRIGYSEGENPTIKNGIKEGTDPYFEDNYKAARAAGLKVGAYIYSYAMNVKQAKLDAKQVLRAIKGKTFDYPIYYDIEDPSQEVLSNELRTEMCIAFMSMLISAGYKPGVYASQNWFDTRLDHEKIAEVGSTWIAKWPASDQADEDHSDYHLWQFRSDGNIGGIHGNIDVNVDFGERENSVYIYTGQPIEPKFEVYSDSGKKLTEGTHYKATFKNNLSVGSATVTYKGIGKYKDKLNFQRKFTIASRSLSDVTIVEPSERTYNGEPIIPTIKATFGDKKLKKGKDYTVTAENNINTGEGTVNVIGKGNYVGTRTFRFTIKKKNIKYADISGIDKRAYTGKRRTLPELKVKTSTTTLKKGKDYTVTYKNNKKIGTATVTINGIGDNCRGTYKSTFNIVPDAPDGIKITKRTESAMKITWGDSKYGDTYQLYRATKENGKYKLIYTTKSNREYIDTNLKSGQHYFYRVRAYRKVDGKKYYSYWAETHSNTKLENTTFTLSADYPEKSITVLAKKNKNVGGYIVYMYKSGKFRKVYSGKSASFTMKELDYNKSYYFKIRTYKKTDYGTIYGKLSKKQSLRMVMPEAPGKPKASKKTTDSVKISWKAVDNAEVYQIFRSTKIDGKYKRVKSSKSAGSFVDQNLKDGTMYYYKVRAYRKVKGEKCYGEFSEVTSVRTKLAGADFALTADKKAKSITVNIKKNKNATGYIVYMYDSKSGEFQKVWAGKATEYTAEKLKTTKRYNFKIRTYKKTSGKTIYGPISSKQTLKIG